MHPDTGFLEVGSQKLHYHRYGAGSEVLIAFHGYGEDASFAAPLSVLLAAKYTIYSIDLPHHGSSNWKDEAKILPKHLAAAVKGIMASHHRSKVTLLGYSIGGRICLSLVQDMPDCISKVVLVAPDGLRANPYYYFFTRTGVGRFLFRNMLQQPAPYLRAIDWLRDMKMVDIWRHKFVMNAVKTKEKRQQLLHAWPAVSLLMPAASKLKQIIRAYSLHLDIYMGAYDRIMPPALATKFGTGLPTVQVHLLEKGHRLLDADSIEQIASNLI